MRRTWTAGFVATALLTSSGMAHAAADVSSADKSAITKVITLVEKPKDAKKSCADGFTSTYLKTLFGTKANCESNLTLEPGEQPTSVKISSISVSGKTGKAKVKERGGANDGASGTWTLTKSGGKWKVSGIDAKWFRSIFTIGLGPDYPSDGPESDPFDSQAYRSCGLKKMLDRSDKDFLKLTYQIHSSRNSEIGKIFAKCTSKAPGGKSPFFAIIENALTSQSGDGGPSEAEAKCVATKLRNAYTEPALINMFFDGPESKAFNTYVERVEKYSQQCTKGGSAGLRAPKKPIQPPIR